MSTIAAGFSAKIRCLNEYQMRILHNTLPQPSGFDISSTMASLTQTLQFILKEVRHSLMVLLRSTEKDSTRLIMFPSLDYKGLFNALVLMLDVAPLLHTGLEEFGKSFIQCMGFLQPFLERDLLDVLPQLIASTLNVFPASIHQTIVHFLIYNILHFINKDGETEVDLYLPTLITMVFKYCDDFAYHCMVLECLMASKKALTKHMLCIIAYGSSEARIAAVRLLMYYWPTFNSSLYQYKLEAQCNIMPYTCQSNICSNMGFSTAYKVCYDLQLSIKYANNNSPPPLYLCIECANEIHREYPKQEFCDILHFIQLENICCENKCCRSKAEDKSIACVCFSMECASLNGNRPIHYCQQCHNHKHAKHKNCDHIFHTALTEVSNMEPVMQTFLIEAIVSLMKEIQPTVTETRDLTDLQSKASHFNILTEVKILSPLDEELVGQFGVWLLIGLFNPETAAVPKETIGRLLSMLFKTLHISSSNNHSVLKILETDDVWKWVRDISRVHPSVFTSCLLPYPDNYIRVGGHWDALISRTSHINNGLAKLCFIINHNIVSYNTWSYTMPHWLEAIVSDVPQKELSQLKFSFSNVLNANNNSLSCNPQQLFNFVTVQFSTPSPASKMRALTWLQILTTFNIAIPLNILFHIFHDGVVGLVESAEENDTMGVVINQPDCSLITLTAEIDSRKSHLQQHAEDDAIFNSTEQKLICSVQMLDIIFKQVKMHNIERCMGLHSTTAQEIIQFLLKLSSAPWFRNVTNLVEDGMESSLSDLTIMWYQFALILMDYICQPLSEANAQDTGKSPNVNDKKEQKGDSMNSPFMEINTIMTATVEAVVEQLDLAPIIILEQMQQLPRIFEPEYKKHDSPDAPINYLDINSPEDRTRDSFNNVTLDVSPQLQYLDLLLQNLVELEDEITSYFTLRIIYRLILHGGILQKYEKEQHGYSVWCQESVIKQMWEFCNFEHSQICEVCVPVLLHCVALFSGSDNIFWNILQESFHSKNWTVRFNAVEKVAVIVRFINTASVRNYSHLQTVIASAFCYLIYSMGDDNALIAQRAALFLGTIHDDAIHSVMLCLENQYNNVIVDRPIILQYLYQLHNSLSDRRILTWEFFYKRYYTLFSEAKIGAEETDGSYVKGYIYSDYTNECFVKKLNKVRETQSQIFNATIKTLSSSFGSAWPYTRNERTSSTSAISERSNVRDTASTAAVTNNSDNCYYYAETAGTSDEIIVKLEDVDGETVHLLVFLLLQFLSRSDHVCPDENRHGSKMQNILLSRLYYLLGYNEVERSFFVHPSNLRQSVVFNTFLSNLVQLLDQNYYIGTIMLPEVVLVLRHCTYSHWGLHPAFCSLWSLEPHARKCWLLSVLVIMYKYDSKSLPSSNYIVELVDIVLNTLSGHNHVCHRVSSVATSAPTQPAYLRDICQRSVIGDTPPQSPEIYMANNKYKKSATSMETHWEEESVLYFNDYSTIDFVMGNQAHNGGNNINNIMSSTDASKYFSGSQGEISTTNRPVWQLGNEDYYCCQSSKTSSNFPSTSAISIRELSPIVSTIRQFVVQETTSRPQSISAQPSSIDVTERSSRLNNNNDTTTGSVTKLSLPTPERLLPVGISPKSAATADHVTKKLEFSNTDLLSQSVERTAQSNASKSCCAITPSKKGAGFNRLTKQLALESPSDDVFVKLYDKDSGSFQRDKAFLNQNIQNLTDYLQKCGFWNLALSSVGANAANSGTEHLFHRSFTASRNNWNNPRRIAETSIQERCGECRMFKEEYGEDELGLCIVILGTFIHREPALAAPILHRILPAIVRLLSSTLFSWQNESNANLPGGTIKVAKQFLRVILHQLTPNGIFIQLFQHSIKGDTEMKVFKNIILALVDFKELCPLTPVVMLLEVMNSKKSLLSEKLQVILKNVATYVECLLAESASVNWHPFLVHYESFLRRIVLLLPGSGNMAPFLSNIIAVLKIPVITFFKGLLEPFSKILGSYIQNCEANYELLTECCHLCTRAFSREREKLVLTRAVMSELIHVLKFKNTLPVSNIFVLINIMLKDAGGIFMTLPMEIRASPANVQHGSHFNISAADVMRHSFTDILDFIVDCHTSLKIKSNYKPMAGISPNEDAVGGILKVSMSQYVAFEMARGNHRDNRALSRYFPWICNIVSPQSTTRDFAECVFRIRLHSWLVTGALTNYCTSNTPCLPIPHEASCYLTDYIQTVLSLFPDNEKLATTHISSVFHCFILCQLWTLYLEHTAACTKPNSELIVLMPTILMEFWCKITPSILHLISNSALVSDMVNLHFMNIMEALLECRSATFNKLLPIWNPILTATNVQIPGHLLVRIQNCNRFPPTARTTYLNEIEESELLSKWLARMYFKINRMEIQTSQTTQFYPV